MDQLLAKALTGTVMTLIVATAVAALVFGYRGVYFLSTAEAEAGVVWLAAGVTLGVGCYLLCRHRHELADS